MQPMVGTKKECKMLQIVSYNVRGLRDNNKRKQVFMYLQKLQVDVVFLQETFSDKESEFIWRSEWAGKMIFAHGNNDSRGVTIMFRKNTDVEIGKTTSDKSGR